MEYFTSITQEQEFNARFTKRYENLQDSVRMCRFPTPGQRELQEEDRVFFVEPDGSIYLGEVQPKMICPCYPVTGGTTYGIDPLFIGEVQDFIQRNHRYMIVFRMCKKYSRKAGIYPARIVSDMEEVMLEEQEE